LGYTKLIPADGKGSEKAKTVTRGRNRDRSSDSKPPIAGKDR